jgi:hypothetical protein
MQGTVPVPPVTSTGAPPEGVIVIVPPEKAALVPPAQKTVA